MCSFTIISDLTPREEEILYSEFPPTDYEYVKIADIIDDNWQSFFVNRRCVGIAKSNDTLSLLEAHDIAMLGYESTSEERLSCAYIVTDLSAIEKADLETVYCRFHDIPLKILETDRCIIREHSVDDYDAICDIYSDKSMTEFMEPLFEPEEEKEYQKQYIKRIYNFFGYGLWLIVSKSDGRVIGRAGVESRESCEDYTQVELSYQVAVPFQRRGIATEVVGAIIDYTFNSLGKESIIARVDEENVASVKLMKKLGFHRREGTDKYILVKEKQGGQR